MVCEQCGTPISLARQAAVPDERLCVQCIEGLGDVERIKGVMLWTGKHAPEFYCGPGTQKILDNQRRRLGAQGNFTAKGNPRMLKSLESFNVSEGMNLKGRPEPEINLEVVTPAAAHCHPTRPRVAPNGMCLECVTDWYKVRLK